MDEIQLNEFLKLSKEDLKGKVVCFPTDTVYGLGAMVEDEAAIAKIYQMKKRDMNKPLAILCPGIEAIQDYVKYISEQAQTWMNTYWPGGLTLIFEKKNLSDSITKGSKTVAFRMPNCEISLSILSHFGLMATTSVNYTGEKEYNTIQEIKQVFGKEIDYIITDPASFSSKPSTVVDVSKDVATVLRQGDIIIKT